MKSKTIAYQSNITVETTISTTLRPHKVHVVLKGFAPVLLPLPVGCVLKFTLG